MATYTIYENAGTKVEIPLSFNLSFHGGSENSALQSAIDNIIESATELSATDEEIATIKNDILSTTLINNVSPQDFNKPGNGNGYTIGQVNFHVPYFEALQYNFGSNVIDITLDDLDIEIGEKPEPPQPPQPPEPSHTYNPIILYTEEQQQIDTYIPTLLVKS